MKDSHLYKRMSNPTAVKVFLHMIRNEDMKTVNDLYGNLKTNADDHPRFSVIQEAYDERIRNTENI